MKRMDIERNAEIVAMRKEGATFQEIAEWYGLSNSRVQEICRRFKDYGNTKEEILRNWEKRQKERQKKWEAAETYREKRRGGRHYAIRNGAAEVFLTEIKGTGGDTVYKYGSKEIRDALYFTLEEARKIARERKAVVCWVP